MYPQPQSQKTPLSRDSGTIAWYTVSPWIDLQGNWLKFLLTVPNFVGASIKSLTLSLLHCRKIYIFPECGSPVWICATARGFALQREKKKTLILYFNKQRKSFRWICEIVESRQLWTVMLSLNWIEAEAYEGWPIFWGTLTRCCLKLTQCERIIWFSFGAVAVLILCSCPLRTICSDLLSWARRSPNLGTRSKDTNDVISNSTIYWCKAYRCEGRACKKDILSHCLV